MKIYTWVELKVKFIEERERFFQFFPKYFNILKGMEIIQKYEINFAQTCKIC